MPLSNLPKLPSPNLPTSGTKIKHVIAWWIAPIIIEDGGCSLTFVKVATPNIIKAVVNPNIVKAVAKLKSPFVTHHRIKATVLPIKKQK